MLRYCFFPIIATAGLWIASWGVAQEGASDQPLELLEETINQSPEVVAKVQQLIAQLGSEDYQQREMASKELLQVGEAAWDHVYAASEGAEELETRYRATELLKSLQQKKYSPLRIWNDHQDIVWAVAFSPDGTLLASGGGGQEQNGAWTSGSDYALRIWDVRKGTLLKKLTGHKNSITCIAWYPDGSKLVTTSGDSTSKVWDPIAGKELFTLLGHTDSVSGVAISADSSRILTGSWDKTCILYDGRTGKALKKLDPIHYGRVWGVALSADGKRAAVCGDHPFIRLWDLTTGTIQSELRGHSQAAVQVAFTPKGDKLISGGWDNSAIVWDLEKSAPLRVCSTHGGRVEGIAVSADGKRFLTGCLDKQLRLWSVESGELLQTYEGHTGSISKVAFTTSGKYGASAGWDRTIRLWPMPR